MKWCKNPDRGLPSPDVVFYLDISIKDAEMRGQFGEERYEKAEFQQRVADIYKQLRSDDWKVNNIVNFVLKNETTTTATTNLFNYSRHTTKADFQVGRRQTHITKTYKK